ncbi:MAG: hypothetical protein AAB221_08190, partial [Bacteroidota bacterium]
PFFLHESHVKRKEGSLKRRSNRAPLVFMIDYYPLITIESSCQCGIHHQRGIIKLGEVDVLSRARQKAKGKR